MMVFVNHAISMVLSPLGFWFFVLIFVAVLAAKGWKRSARLWKAGKVPLVVASGTNEVH